MVAFVCDATKPSLMLPLYIDTPNRKQIESELHTVHRSQQQPKLDTNKQRFRHQLNSGSISNLEPLSIDRQVCGGVCY